MKVELYLFEATAAIRKLANSGHQFEREASGEVFSFVCDLFASVDGFDKDTFRDDCFSERYA